MEQLRRGGIENRCLNEGRRGFKKPELMVESSRAVRTTQITVPVSQSIVTQEKERRNKSRDFGKMTQLAAIASVVMMLSIITLTSSALASTVANGIIKVQTLTQVIVDGLHSAILGTSADSSRYQPPKPPPPTGNQTLG